MCPAIAGKQNCLPCCAVWVPYLLCCQGRFSKMDFFLSCTDVVLSCLCLRIIFHWFSPFLWGFVWFCLFPQCLSVIRLFRKSGSHLCLRIDLSLTPISRSLFSIPLFLGTSLCFVSALVEMPVMKISFENCRHVESCFLQATEALQPSPLSANLYKVDVVNSHEAESPKGVRKLGSAWFCLSTLKQGWDCLDLTILKSSSSCSAWQVHALKTETKNKSADCSGRLAWFLSLLSNTWCWVLFFFFRMNTITY